MSASHERRIDKWKVYVQLELNTGAQMLGYVFIMPHQQRLQDLLNDDRSFLPFVGSDGLTQLVRTSAIVRVAELAQEVLPGTFSDPYDVLGVPYGVSDLELRNVYLELCRRYHPDRLASFGLPKEVMATAHTMTVRIIDAYSRILKDRNAKLDPKTAA